MLVPGLIEKLPLSLAVGLTLFRGRGKSRVSTATIVSVIGIAVGVATLTAVLAVTGGFEAAFRDRILGVYPHIVVLQRGESFTDYAEVARRLEALPNVQGSNPSTYDEMMVSSDLGAGGAIVKGVDLEGVDHVSNLRSLMTQGHLDDLLMPGDLPGVVVGCELFARLKIGLGDRVTLTTPLRGLGDGGSGPFGMAPVQQGFRVRGCFDSGFYEYDARLVIMELGAAQRFLNRGNAVRWVELRIADLFATDLMRREILGTLQPYTLPDLLHDAVRLREDIARVMPEQMTSGQPFSILDLVGGVARVQRSLEYSEVGAGPPQRYRLIDWKEMNRNLFSALRMQKAVLALFFLIIVLVAAFNMVGTQIIVARERVREISTLVAVGASPRQLYGIFVAHGSLLGAVGVLMGLLLGAGIVKVIQEIDFALDPKVYLITRLPATLDLSSAALIGLASFGVVFLSCLLSSLRAGRVNPVDGLRKIS